MADPLTASIQIAAAPERVFAHFIDPDAMVRWMGDYALLEASPGGRFEVDPPHRLVISWGHAGSERMPPGSTTLEVRLTAAEGGTRVDIEHRGLPEPEATGYPRGWRLFLERLAVAS